MILSIQTPQIVWILPDVYQIAIYLRSCLLLVLVMAPNTDQRKGRAHAPESPEMPLQGNFGTPHFVTKRIADRVIPTPQTPNFLELLYHELILVFDYEMSSYVFWACPLGITERTLVRGLMLVPYMSSLVLKSSIFFVAITMMAGPLCGTFSTLIGSLRKFSFWGTSGPRKL